MRIRNTVPLLVLGLLLQTGCEQKYGLVPKDKPNSELCERYPDAEACDKRPKVTTPGVVTILFTMSQIPQSAGTLILANAIKYASPKENPKILYLADSDLHGEDVGDADYIKNTFLLGYDLDYSVILSGGLSASQTAGYDLIIVHNPGYPLQDQKTRDTLAGFKGGVILVGDDMSQGDGFSLQSFTGLTFKKNGSSVSCDGQTYPHDNVQGHRYRVSMNSTLFPGIPEQHKNYEYGNDIDHTEAGSGLQVLATAQAAAGTCNIGLIPVVTRRPK